MFRQRFICIKLLVSKDLQFLTLEDFNFLTLSMS